jgi:polysaccharide pyruvyl transferase WcaK-like protein
MEITKQILIIGIGGVYNLGCEAIIRGLFGFLEEENSAISYASYETESDQRILIDCAIKVIKRPFKKLGIENILRNISEKCNIAYFPNFDHELLNRDYAAIFAIGGDNYIYTKSQDYCKSIISLGNEASKRNIPFILFGCSLDMNYKTSREIGIVSNHLKSIKSIVIRENETKQVLERYGIIANVIFMPDVAFSMENGEYNYLKHRMSPNSITIGINLSPIASCLHEKCSAEALNSDFKLLAHIKRKTHAKLILIPHVFCENEVDDDLKYLIALHDLLRRHGFCDIEVLTEKCNFQQRKAAFRNLDLFIGARMHCCINSITCRVPTIFLGYSIKAKGMAKFVYGHEEYFHSLPIANYNTLDDSINKILSNNVRERLFIDVRLAEIRKQLDASWSNIKTMY